MASNTLLKPWPSTAPCSPARVTKAASRARATDQRAQCDLHAARLDDLPGELIVCAERLSGDANNILYQFSVSHADRCLLAGRAAVSSTPAPW